MNIFASDLDQTLIYSKKWIIDNEEVLCVEMIRGQEGSFISKAALDELIDISEKDFFIPVTTRTEEQYRRINFNDVSIKYAIVANGAKILIDGVIDQNWAQIVKEAFKCILSVESVYQELCNLKIENGLEKIKIADDVFVYIIVDELTFDKGHLENYRDRFEGWQMYDQGRKIYFVPNIIQKGLALAYLINQLKPQKVVCSGDSLLDMSLIDVSDIFISPVHSKLNSDIELVNKGIINGYGITKAAYAYLSEK